LFSDIRKWTRDDPDFKVEYDRIQGERWPHMVARSTQNRPTKVELDPDKYEGWMEDVAKVCVATGSMKKASMIDTCPYSVGYLYEMANPNSPNFNTQFAKAIQFVTDSLNDEMREGVIESSRALPPGKAKAWVNMQWLQRRDPDFADKKEVDMKGNVTHTHGLRDGLEERLAALNEERKKFFEYHRPKMLHGEDIIEGEVVNDSE
jgi:hypothetical protein